MKEFAQKKNGFLVEIYNEPSLFDDLKDEWDDLLERTEWHSFFQTSRWNSIWWSHFGQGLDPFILVVKDKEGVLRGLAPLYIHIEDGGRKVARFLGGLELSDYLDFVIEKGMEQTFFEAIGSYFTRMGERPELDLHFIPENSPSLGTKNPFFDGQELSIEVRKEEVCPAIDLPPDWEEYLRGLRQKDRHELLRKMRRAEAVGSLNYYRTSRMEDIERDVRTFCELHRKSRDTKRGFMDDKMSNFFEEFARMLFSGGNLFLNFLSINGRALASLFGIRYAKGVSIYNSGFDPDFGHISPGIVLIGYAIREAIEDGYIFFDLLRGSEPYKYRFGARDRWLYNIKIGFPVQGT